MQKMDQSTITQVLEPKPRAFPYPYQIKEDTKIAVSPGFAGVAVVMPAGSNAKHEMDFRIVLYVDQAVGSVTVKPRALGMMVIDLPDGFRLTAEGLTPIVRNMWVADAGRPGPPGVILGRGPP